VPGVKTFMMKQQPTAPPLLSSQGTGTGQAESIYPELPAEGQAEPALAYRLQQVSLLKRQLEEERDQRAALYKKYHRGVNALDGVEYTLITASMGMGIGGVGLLATIIAAPVVLGLEVAAVVCGLLGVAGKFVSRRLAVKAKKHDEIRVLAESKLNTIADHVSTALVDGEISDHEFRLILGESEKYQQMKDQIRSGAQKAYGAVTPPVLDEATKNSLIQRGRDEARTSFIKKLSAAPFIA
jgi:hypothetical protein